ncbi:MAG: Crp/Fnr family transcriptional regulator [Patescibacteria group bacterium]|jgi:CRP/FNR family transcriptional regulator
MSFFNFHIDKEKKVYTTDVTQITLLEKATEEFFKNYPRQMLRKKSIIVDKDHEVDSIFFLEKGFVQMFTYDPNGKKVLIHIFRPGAFFPLLPKISTWSTHRQYIFEAMTPIVVRKSPSDHTVEFLRQHPDILFHTLERITDALVGSVERFKQMNEDTNGRIVMLLQYLIKSFGKAEGRQATINLKLTHQDVAAWIGVSRESVTRFISELKRKKIIRVVRGGLKILDLQKLKKAA